MTLNQSNSSFSDKSRVHEKMYLIGEKATKKKVICVRWMSVNLTSSALSELIILPKGTRRPPNGYTLVGYVSLSGFIFFYCHFFDWYLILSQLNFCVFLIIYYLLIKKNALFFWYFFVVIEAVLYWYVRRETF